MRTTLRAKLMSPAGSLALTEGTERKKKRVLNCLTILTAPVTPVIGATSHPAGMLSRSTCLVSSHQCACPLFFQSRSPMYLPILFSFSAPLINWPESDLKLLTAVWIRAYKNAWNLGKSTANCLFTVPRDKGGLQVKLPLGTLFTSVWGNLERCSNLMMAPGKC